MKISKNSIFIFCFLLFVSCCLVESDKYKFYIMSIVLLICVFWIIHTLIKEIKQRKQKEEI